jgi:RHS repeat-associated protein
MANISYRAASTLTNKYAWNGGNEYEDEGELNYSNTFYRKYDAQIGRFTGVDIKAEEQAVLNPYQFGANNPVMFNDPLGDLSIAEFNTILNTLWSSPYGGTWSSNSGDWGGGGGGGFGGGSNIYLFGNESTATFFGGLAANGINYSFGNGNLRIRDLFVTSVENKTNKRGEAGLNFRGYYERGNAAEGNRLAEVTIGSLFFKNTIFFGANNTNQEGDRNSFLGNANDAISPFGIPLSGLEYQLGKALDKSNRLDQIKPFNEAWMLKNNPYLKTRPVNVQVPLISRHFSVPRNVVTKIGKGLQALGVVSSVISAANDIDKYRNGEISGAHLTVNLVMNAVGFFGPVGTGISILYGLTEDWFWDDEKK